MRCSKKAFNFSRSITWLMKEGMLHDGNAEDRADESGSILGDDMGRTINGA